MKSKKLAFALSLFLLTGSANSEPKYQMDHLRIKTISGINGFINACVSKGLLSNDAAFQFATASSKLLAVSEVDQAQYAYYYQDGIKWAERVVIPNPEKHCAKLREDLLFPMIESMREDYRAISQWQNEVHAERVAEIEQALSYFNNSLRQFNQNMAAYNRQIIPMPSGQVTFGLPQNNNYMCMRTSPGYVYCR